MCFGILFSNNIFAAQKKYTYTDNCLSSYSGYEALIKNLKAKHPTWTFTILETGLDWNDVIKNESVASHGRNLIWYTNGGGWVCSNCGDKLYDSGRWKCASETTVAYYMDPRNWLNENNIFQFENLAYNGEVQNVEGVKKILSSVPWANGDKIVYTQTDGTQATLEKSYAQVIMEAAESAGISPYHLAARIKQEQGVGATASSTGHGNYSGYAGCYNFLNIKATGSNIIGNALSYARECGWDNPEKSIKGGAIFLAKDYISRGQSTLYLQKFDVDNSEGALYYHQYMQNVSAALTEGNTVRSSYEEMGLLDSNLNFVIPVFNNMPQDVCPSPDGISIVTQNVEITGDLVAVREGKSTAYKEIATLNKGDKLLRIETATFKENGFYWDKVVLADGRKGYVARDFTKQIADITNASTSAIANTAVNLRNGPGTSGTKVLTTLISGQSVTIIETGKYNGVDGYNWVRIKLANGTQGYLVADYVSEATKVQYQMAYVNCNDDGIVNIRSGIGTGNPVVTGLRKNAKVTVLQKNAGSANGYNWDKIVTDSGLNGYIANVYLTYENNTPPSEEKPKAEPPKVEEPTVVEENAVVIPGDNGCSMKIVGNTITAEPNAKVSNIKAKFPNAVIYCGTDVLKDENLLGTGNRVVIEGAEFTVTKLGDVNGDGVIKSNDYMRIKNYIMKSSSLDGAFQKAADVNGDGQVKSNDYMKIKNYIMNTSKINL